MVQWVTAAMVDWILHHLRIFKPVFRHIIWGTMSSAASCTTSPRGSDFGPVVAWSWGWNWLWNFQCSSSPATIIVVFIISSWIWPWGMWGMNQINLQVYQGWSGSSTLLVYSGPQDPNWPAIWGTLSLAEAGAHHWLCCLEWWCGLGDDRWAHQDHGFCVGNPSEHHLEAPMAAGLMFICKWCL